VIALALSTLLPAGAAWAAGNDTLIYCSEASPESFNPQIASSGPSFVASSQVLYNRLITFDPVKNTPIPSLATDWTVSQMVKPGLSRCAKAFSSTAINILNRPAILTPMT
jgi:ABC-type transport system substrate-binding protein